MTSSRVSLGTQLMRKQGALRSASLLLLAMLLLRCGGGYGNGGVTGPPGDNLVDAVGVTSWNPSAVTVKVGEDVTFRNSSGTAHNVQFDQAVAGHPGNVGDFSRTSKAVTFTTAGTFTYHCGIHPAMQGQVVVEP